jgi:hypothetical protein
VKPPFREDSHLFTGKSGAEESSPGGDSAPAVRKSVTYVELSNPGTWEDRQRPRSCPNSAGLLFCALSIFVMWLSTAGVVLALIMKFNGHAEPWSRVSVICLIVMAVSLVISLIFSMTRHCPLCHGTPLHSRRCPKHRLADRWLPLTHRATVVVRMLTTLSFRCMYCGTPFRLFKKSSRQR